MLGRPCAPCDCYGELSGLESAAGLTLNMALLEDGLLLKGGEAAKMVARSDLQAQPLRGRLVWRLQHRILLGRQAITGVRTAQKG